MNDVSQAWREFCEMEFPEEVYEDDTGFELTSIDTFAAGCVDTCLSQHGRLDSERMRILQNCHNDLCGLLPGLSGYPSVYFSKLKGIMEAAMQVANGEQ